MITTRLYQLDIRDSDWNIAHIYEHLLIAGAKHHFKMREINPDLFGWISGDTFEEQLFLHAGFYTLEAAHFFDAYLSRPQQFTPDEVEAAVATVEQEDRAHINLSTNELQPFLTTLSHKKWNTLAKDPPETPPTHLMLQKSAKDFRDISIGVASIGLSPEEAKVFLRCRPIISDIISEYLNSLQPAYQRGTSPVVHHVRQRFCMIFTINKVAGRLTELQDTLKNHLVHYPIEENWPAFRAHFDGFAKADLLKDSAVEYFRNTGIVTTTEEINHLATKAILQKIFAQIRIHIRSTTPDDRSAVFDL